MNIKALAQAQNSRTPGFASIAKNRGGFTMVELLAAITVIGILTVIYVVFFVLPPKPEDTTNKGTILAAGMYTTYSNARKDESLNMDTDAFETMVVALGTQKTIGNVKAECMKNPVFETSTLCTSLEGVLKIWSNSKFKIEPVAFSTVKANYLNDAGTAKYGKETLSDDARGIQICFEQKDASKDARRNICGVAMYDSGQKWLNGWVKKGDVTY